MAAPAPTTAARPAPTAEPNINRAARPAPLRTPTSRHATDDEILGLGEHAESSNRAAAPEPSSRESRNARDRAHVTEFNSPRAGAPPFASKGGDVRNVQDPTPPESDVIPPALAQEGSEASDPSSAAPPAASPHANDATHAAAVAEPEHLRAALDANPELRAAWLDANAYRETFPTPDDARAATASL